MFKGNEGTLDRGLRVVVGVAMVVAGFFFIGGTIGLIVGIVGFVPIVTGALGFCPLYRLFGFSTCPVSDRP